jgi:hypothetical protein
VGKTLVQGSMEAAAMVFLAKPSPHEHPESRRVRAELEATHDFKQALQSFPSQLRFERLMLAHLVEDPSDFSGAFRRLPLKLQKLFVQAWETVGDAVYWLKSFGSAFGTPHIITNGSPTCGKVVHPVEYFSGGGFNQYSIMDRGHHPDPILQAEADSHPEDIGTMGLHGPI